MPGQKHLILRFDEAVHDAAFWPRIDKELCLQRRIPDYRIGPHNDIATRAFTCIFSFANRTCRDRSDGADRARADM